MSCANPNYAYRIIGTKNKLIFDRTLKYNPKYEEIITNCRKCTSCRIHQSKTWALRCHLEASMHENNTWVTLTYNDKHLPPNGTLRDKDLTLFIKNLKRMFQPANPTENQKITYFACGEYGEKYERPHYHVCIFNHKFPDATFLRYDKSTRISYSRSRLLERLWTNGFSDCSPLSKQAAAYTARYCLKKKFGAEATEAYTTTDRLTGEYTSITPEFVRMSTAPAIGKRWWDTFKKDTLKDYLVIDGITHGIPTYFDKLMDKESPELLEQLKIKRRAALENLPHDSHERRAVKEQLLKNKLKRLIRTFEGNHHVGANI